MTSLVMWQQYGDTSCSLPKPCIEKNGSGMTSLHKTCHSLDKNGRGTSCVDFSKYFFYFWNSLKKKTLIGWKCYKSLIQQSQWSFRVCLENCDGHVGDEWFYVNTVYN